MIDQNLLKAYPDEAAYERDSLTNAIQKHVYNCRRSRKSRDRAKCCQAEMV